MMYMAILTLCYVISCVFTALYGFWFGQELYNWWKGRESVLQPAPSHWLITDSLSGQPVSGPFASEHDAYCYLAETGMDREGDYAIEEEELSCG